MLALAVLARAQSPADGEAQAPRGRGVEVATYPATYHLLAVSPETFIAARVFNGGSDPDIGYGGVVGKRHSGPRQMRTAAEPPAGAVTEVQILSRGLERPGPKK